MTQIERIVNLETGETTEREYTKEEIAAAAAHEKEMQAIAVLEAQKAADKAALLAKLGITEDEAALLLS
jgi:hypothetical protein